MTRVNTDATDFEQLRQAVRQLAERNNQIERMLDGKEIYETTFLDGKAHQRTTKFSLSSGMVKSDWRPTDIDADGVDSIVAGTDITIDPESGVGDVTINADVDVGVESNIAGAGISVSSATGDVTIGNTGVLSVTGGDITVDVSTGNITIDLPAGGSQYQSLQRDGSGDAHWDWTRWV